METIKSIIATLLVGLAFLGAMLIGTQANAQSWEGTHIYTPAHTKHFSSNPLYDNSRLGSEGGSEGFLITRSSRGLHFTMGIMQNSYGDYSKYLMFGFNLSESNTSQLSIQLGVADNYGKAYLDEVNARLMSRYLPSTMVKNSRIPIVTATYKVRLTNLIGLQFNLSPAFINSGLYIQI